MKKIRQGKAPEVEGKEALLQLQIEEAKPRRQRMPLYEAWLMFVARVAYREIQRQQAAKDVAP